MCPRTVAKVRGHIARATLSTLQKRLVQPKCAVKIIN